MQVVAVGLGKPKHARHFGEKLAPSVECITNEEPELYDTYGIGRMNPVGILLKPDSFKAGARAAKRGFRQGKTTGDALRKPGTFIVDENGTIQYAYYSDYAGDYPEIPDVLAEWAVIQAEAEK